MKTLKIFLRRINPLTAIVNAVTKARAAERYMKIMFDYTPLSASLWDTDYKIIDCNLEAARMFGLTDKNDFMERPQAFSPEYQPCGRLSRELAIEYIKKSFDEGPCRYEWVHLSANGEPIPCEIFTFKVEHKGRPIVAAYKRDLRETNAALDAMRKVEDDLRIALAAAENSARVKSEFLDNMNHELRTPLNGILGFLRMAAQADLIAEQRRHIRDAEKSAKDLLKIVSDVLDFTEIEEQKIRVSSELFWLSDVLDRVTEKYSDAIRAKDIDFNIRLSPDIPEQLIGDPGMLEKILASLIDNAVKFTERGKITVRASAKKKTDSSIELCFYVRDTGIGIKPEQIPLLFNPFWQADTSLTREYGGIGFGLPLSKHLAALLGGRIWAESEYEEGSTFYFTALCGVPGFVDLTRYNIPAAVMHDEPAFDEPAYDEKSHDPNSPHLLVVEDVEINQLIAEDLLKGMGYSVDIASNGQEAIDMLAEKDYDAVLMDIQMPVMDGLTATARIREENKHRDLPIIAVSAHALVEDREKSLAYGMNDHIAKPIDPERLIFTLNKWLKPA